MRLLRLAACCLSAALLAAVATPSVSGAGENLGMCDDDAATTLTSSIGDELWFCFDGETLVLRNEGNLVFDVVGGGSAERSMHGWLPGSDDIMFGGDRAPIGAPTADEGIIAPGWTLELDAAPGATVTVAVDRDLTDLFAERNRLAALYGLIAIAGDALGIVAGLNAFFDELEDAAIQYADCRARATDFWGRTRCNAGHKWNVSFAIGRVGFDVLPLINDLPTVMKAIDDFVSGFGAGWTWAEMTVGVDLEALGWAEPETITIELPGEGNGRLAVDRDGVGGVAFGSPADTAISRVMRALGEPTIDTGWSGEFFRFDAGFGGLHEFQRTYLTYRRTCWFPDELCLLHGETLDGGDHVFVGWSLGRSGYWDEEVAVATVRTVEGVAPGVGIRQVDAVTPVEPVSGEASVVGFVGDYFGTLDGIWQWDDPEAAWALPVACIGAGAELQAGWVLAADPCPYGGPEGDPGSRPAGQPIAPSWVAILDSLPTAEHTAQDGLARAEEFEEVATWVAPIVIFESDGYRSLNPGYWVVALSAGYGTEADAAALCRAIGDVAVLNGNVCYPRQVE